MSEIVLKNFQKVSFIYRCKREYIFIYDNKKKNLDESHKNLPFINLTNSS